VLENCGSVGGRVFDTRGHCDKKITVVKFGVDNKGGNGGGSFGIEVRMDAAKLMNMIIAGFGE